MSSSSQPTASDGVAVVIPSYNRATFVDLAIESALAQRPIVREIVVADDGSTDNTAEVVAGYKDHGVRLLRQANQGAAAARNLGWKDTTSPWVQFIDSDDFIPAGSLAKLLERAASSPGSIPYGYQEIHEKQVGPKPLFTAWIAHRDGWLREELCVQYQGNIFTALIPRPVLEAIGGFWSGMRYGEDYDFAARLGLNSSFVSLNYPTYASRMHGGNKHRTIKDNVALKDRLASIQRNLGSSADSTARSLANRARSRWYYHYAMESMKAGDPRNARSLFLGAIRFQPSKLGAWKGFLRCFGSPAQAPPDA